MKFVLHKAEVWYGKDRYELTGVPASFYDDFDHDNDVGYDRMKKLISFGTGNQISESDIMVTRFDADMYLNRRIVFRNKDNSVVVTYIEKI